MSHGEIRRRGVGEWCVFLPIKSWGVFGYETTPSSEMILVASHSATLRNFIYSRASVEGFERARSALAAFVVLLLGAVPSCKDHGISSPSS